MKSYNLTLKIRNNYLLSVMKANGISSAAELSRRSGVNQSVIGHFLNLTTSGFIKNTGDWKPSLVRIAEYLRVTPDMLIPPQHAQTPLAKNRGEFEVSSEEAQEITGGTTPLIEAAPFDAVVQDEKRECLSGMIAGLSDRERIVIDYRFGLSGEKRTYDEIGKEMRLSRERVRQIERKGLRRLHHMSQKGTKGDRIRSVMGVKMGDPDPQLRHRLEMNDSVQHFSVYSHA